MLQNLALSGNRLPADAVEAVVEGMLSQPWLGSISSGDEVGISLDLSTNALSPAAAERIARSPALHTLRLHDCELGASFGLLGNIWTGDNSSTSGTDEPGTRPFAGLRELDVTGNGISVEGMLRLLSLVHQGRFPQLRLLVVAANPGAMDEAVLDNLQLLLEDQPTLTVIRQ
jgi:hypothetical protein